MHETDDYEMRAAIEASRRDMELSRQHGNSSKASHPTFVDLTADSDHDSDIQEVFPKSKSVVSSEAEDDHGDEELQRALAMSLEIDNTDGKDKVPEDKKPDMTSIATQASSVPVGLSGLDRKQMEQERLARLAKRKAVDDAASPEIQPHRKITKVAPPSTESPLVRQPVISQQHLVSSPIPRADAVPKQRTYVCPQTAANAPGLDIQPTARPMIQWPLGAVKKTALDGFPRQGNDITIEEVIQRSELELAIFSSFLWDMEWLFTKLDIQKTRFMLVMQANDQSLRDQYISETADIKNVRLCFPPMDSQVFCMHSKLMLFFHTTYLRIAVPTANLTSFDWGRENLMENTVFLIDLPKIGISTQKSRTPFYEELVYFLEATTLHRNVIKKLEEYDFSETVRYAFIHTIGGVNTGESWRRTGYCGLGRALKTLGLNSPSPINIDYVTSSMGSLNTGFLRSIYLACKGEDGVLDYTLRTKPTKSGAEAHKKLVNEINKECLDRFRIYFPSDQTVKASHQNPDNTAGTICFNPKWWMKEDFPRRALRDCESLRGSLMHNKLAYVHRSKPIPLPDHNECRGWAYVGSANLSESAWGRLTKEPKTNQYKMNCRNWECGVIVPVINKSTDPNDNQKAEKGKGKDKAPEVSFENDDAPAPLPVELFQDTIPVPMKIPAAELNQNRKPFIYGA
ncbi:hypothetical protein N7499_008768 [Penicillium canescens]|nr:hypothetical protein N7499_008768 [Penicillium canescens]KAJ6159096.1 hypothetical protein N7485_011922 [Penicillium canescens]